MTRTLRSLAAALCLIASPALAQNFTGDGTPVFGLKKSTGQIGIRTGPNSFVPIGTVDPITKAWSAIGGGGGGCTSFSCLTGQIAISQIADGSIPNSKLATPGGGGGGAGYLKNTTDTFTGTLTVTGNIVTQKLSLGGNLGTAALLDIQGNNENLGLTVPPFNMKISEAANGYAGIVGVMTRLAGATGNLREAAHIAYLSHGGVANENIVGVLGYTRIMDGGGTAFGMNPYAQVDSGTSNASAIAMEADTDVRATVVSKIGISMIDVATSTVGGSLVDAGFVVGQQTGARGYNVGIQFGVNAAQNAGTSADPGFGVTTGGTLIGTTGASRSLAAAIDFTSLAGGFTKCGICMPVGSTFNFGGAGGGGSIISGTGTNGPQLVFGSNQILLRTNGGGAVLAGFSTTSVYLNLPASGGTVKGTVCSDTAGNIYVKTTSGACL